MRERLSAFLDGELKEDEHRRVASHLESCESCLQECEDLKHLGEILLNLEGAEPPPYLWQRIQRKIGAPERIGLFERLVQRFVYAPVGVAVLIGVFIGNQLGQSIFRQFILSEVESLNLSSLDDFPPGSLSDAYFSEWEEDLK